jgi:hypothetical protein
MEMEADVSRHEEVLARLEEAFSNLETLAVHQATAEPRRAREIEEAKSAVRAALDEIRDMEEAQESDERLAEVVEQLALFTRTAQRRADASEKRLRRIERSTAPRTGSVFKANKKIVKEGKWLAGMLAGPPSPDRDLHLLKDGAGAAPAASIDVLWDALMTRRPPGAAQTATETPASDEENGAES